MRDIGDCEEVSSECVSNLPGSPAICVRPQRQSFEEYSPCVSTELAASKFEERGCRASFPSAPEAALCTPPGPGHQRDAAGLGPQPISAQLLLSAQEKLREAYAPNVPAAPLLGTPFYSGAAHPEAFASCCARAHKSGIPACLEKQGSCSGPAHMNSLRARLQHSALAEAGIAVLMHKEEQMLGRQAFPAPSRVADAPAILRGRKRCAAAAAAALAESDEDTLSSSSSTSSKKRRRADAGRQQESWVKGLLLERQQLHARCAELEACNARLMRQLSAALRTLQSERTTSQAEVARLRQKCTALGAFLPPSVAAFACGSPPEILPHNRHALLRSQSTP